MWASILTKLIQALVFPLIDKLWDLFNNYLERQKSKKKDDQTAEEARQEMEKSKTGEEIDESVDDILSGI